MAVLDCMVRSTLLEMDTRVQVFIPDNRDGKTFRPERIVYLLHGYGRAADQWLRETFVEKDCARHGFVAVCPDVGHSFYTDLEYGQPFFSYITDELPTIIENFFHFHPGPENTYIAGLSMGGYGAMKAALTYPERYAAAGTFAGALDVDALLQFAPQMGGSLGEKEATAMFGVDGTIPEEDKPLFLLDKAADLPDGKRPKLYQCVGKQDPIYALNTAFHKKADALGIPLVYEEWDGIHNYKFWTESLSRCLEYFATGELPTE